MSHELQALRRIEALLQALVRISLSATISKFLTDDRLRDLYWNTGNMTRGKLERRTGFSAGKISGLWQQWEQAGLLIKSGQSYRRPFE